MKLKPCPFCGESCAEAFVVDNGGDCPPKNFIEKWAVECDFCVAEGPWAESKELSISAWNTRK